MQGAGLVEAGGVHQHGSRGEKKRGTEQLIGLTRTWCGKNSGQVEEAVGMPQLLSFLHCGLGCGY